LSGLALLLRTEALVAVDKPPGMLVIPGRGESTAPSVQQLLEGQLGRRVWVVHRLDRDTSGVLLFALNETAHRSLSMAFEHGKIDKRYLALVEGAVDAPFTRETALVPARRGRMREAHPGETGKPARTDFTPRERFASAALVEAKPLTGRTHQIRVHLRGAHHPLLVDHQYGRAEPLRAKELGGVGEDLVLERTPLHACRATVPLLEGVDAVTIESPLPADMEHALRLLRGTTVTG
jgi:tRNA pseudouridine32 synthase/23S rRNA pseudouridine746 synthase/23S rRNA pseudouridine955/2504/2580 synthase